MTDSTTPKDLAKKIEWVGLRNLSYAEREHVATVLIEVSQYLPRLLALALWSYFGEKAPEHLITRGAECSLANFKERESSRAMIKDLMSDYREEESWS